MDIPSSYFGTVVRGNWLYIAGGRNSPGALQRIDVLTGQKENLQSMRHEYFDVNCEMV